MLQNPWIAALLAAFAWWGSTGALLWLVARADRRNQHQSVVLVGLPVLALGWAGLFLSTGMATVAGAYLGFAAALVIWGWIELAFLTGVLTGPAPKPCPPGVPPWERFIRAWGTIAYSEMAIAVSLAAIAYLSWGAENRVGMWTFAILFLARISAKLNLYLGVPNINHEFLPGRMRHLASHFRTAPMNALFPLSVTLLTFATACWVERTMASTGGTETGFALLAALTALALIEHWVMVVPVQDAKLWRWMVPDMIETEKTVRRGKTHGV